MPIHALVVEAPVFFLQETCFQSFRVSRQVVSRNDLPEV